MDIPAPSIVGVFGIIRAIAVVESPDSKVAIFLPAKKEMTNAPGFRRGWTCSMIVSRSCGFTIIIKTSLWEAISGIELAAIP
jgi:hypothetical protein